MKNRACLPCVKSAGGKRRLLPELLKYVPASIEMYAEPFVGGGALFFHIWPRCKNAILIDQNKDLIVFYRALRDEPRKLMQAARHNWAVEEDAYYRVRALDPKTMPDIERAARFLYLNKLCFNGLWRVNAKGRFNVPWGRYKNPLVVDKKTLLRASRALQIARIIHSDFTTCERYDPDFTYCDPPYDPVSSSSDFTRYAKNDFTWKDQKRLEDWAWTPRSREKGCVMLSNADTSRVRKLYRKWNIATIKAARSINANGDGRGKVNELIIT